MQSPSAGHRSTGNALPEALARVLRGPFVPAVVAAVLGLIGLGDKSFWLDEAFSVSVARLPTLELVSFLWREELHAAPFYLVLQPWLALGTSETATRALAVAFGVTAVMATFMVGKRYGVAFRAALLVAVFPLFIRYEQEVRVYTLATAWSAIATLAYLRFSERPTTLRAATYVGIGAIAIYVHPFVALVIGAHAVAAVVLRPRKTSGQVSIPNVRLLALYVPIAIAWLPMVRFMLMHRDKIEWIPALTPGLLAEYLLTLGGGVVLAAFAFVLLVMGMRRDLPALWLMVPLVAAIVISVLVQPMIQARYLLVLVPAAAIVIARNRPILLAAFVALSLVGVADWLTRGVKDDWRSAVAWVSSTEQPGDGIVFAPHYTRLAFAYYGQAGEPLYPSVAWSDRYMQAMGLDIDIPVDVDNARIWLVEEIADQIPPPVAEVLAGYITVESRTYGTDGPYVTLMQRLP